MTGIRAFFSMLMLALLAGCETLATPAPEAAPTVVVADDEQAEWVAVASVGDQEKLGQISLAWEEGLATVRANDFLTAVEREGALLDPDAGLPRPLPTPGSYRCRLVKLGAADQGDPAFIAYQPFFCYIDLEGDLFTIVKQTGTQRPAGRLWEDEEGDRLIFLGSLALGNENAPLAYGDDPERDMAGIFERIEPFRWRLAIPYPRNGGILDVFELTPTEDQP